VVGIIGQMKIKKKTSSSFIMGGSEWLVVPWNTLCKGKQHSIG